MALDDAALDGIVPPLAVAHPAPAPKVAGGLHPPRTVGITVDTNADPYRGVLAICQQGEPERTQPDWYMPGYRSIGMRLCDGEWVTCGNSYPCATPTPKDGTGSTIGYGDTPDAGLGDSGGYNYYAPPPGWQQATKPKRHPRR